MGYTAENQIAISNALQSQALRQPETNNYLMNTSFRFMLNKTPKITYFCQRANIPDFSLEGIEQPVRYGARVFKAGDKYNYGDLQISFLVDENMENYLEMHDWLRSCANLKDTKEFEGRENFTSGADLYILNSNLRVIKTVRFTDVIPTSLGAINFDSTNSDTEPIVVDATFKFTHYDILPE